MLIRLPIAYALLLVAAALSREAEATPPATAHVITEDRPELVIPVRCLHRDGAGKFVRVDIARVTNPGEVPLAFQVYFQGDGAHRKYVGSFALYPATRPGRFIVPSSGLSPAEGEIVLVLEPLPAGEASGAVEVWVRSVDWADGL